MVLIVMGLVGSIAVPRFARAMNRYRANAAAQRVMVDIARVQSEARATSSRREIYFIVNSDSYEVCDLTDADHQVTHLANIPYNAVITGADFNGDNTVLFDGYGVPDAGGWVTVRVGDSTRTVVIEAESGRLTVQ